MADSGEQYGTVSLDGKMGSMEGVFQIDYHGNTIEMNPVRKQIAKKTLNRDFLHIPFRPYSVSSGNQTGWVYNDKVKLDRGSTRCHIL
ncbi:MAG: hypothetical protein K5673_07200, partial [Lachnospiraceae bacterium]|nr:hypothetical protein [Lachnospiraceae bacterium]